MDGVPLDSVTDTPPDPGSKGNDGGCGGGMAMVSGGDGRRVLEAMLRRVLLVIRRQMKTIAFYVIE